MIKRKKPQERADLEETVEAIKERHGEGSIMKLGEVKSVHIEAISTSSLALDFALGGGIPKGRVIEIFGPESSGKTTLALHIIAEAQKRDGIAAFIDAEHALDPDYARRLGVKTEDLLISQPDTGEQALDIVESLVRSGKIGVIVVDSVAALTPRAQIEGEMGDQQIALQARLMSQALGKLTAIKSKVGTSIIFLNQTRMKISTFGFGRPETTPGGLALKFYASVRLDLRRVAKIKRGEEIIGSRIRAKVVKNKVAAPFKTAEFDIIYNEGVSKVSDILNTGIKYNIVKTRGNTIEFEGKKLGTGQRVAKKFLTDNPKILGEIENKIKKHWQEKKMEGVEKNIHKKMGT
ncbi:MAG: recombinase RecA [Candidatus Bathyarchaeota archaeon]|nr:recombinase RecA [Candidatus Bathyarchaeota archaeon]